MIIAGIVGALMGSFTGIVPGIHANTLAIMLLSVAIAIESVIDPYVSSYVDTRLLLAVIIGATSLAHTFANFIPGTFLGAPDGEVALSVLPMHKMVREGRGGHAINLSVIGSFGAVIFCMVTMLLTRIVIGEPLPNNKMDLYIMELTIPEFLQRDGYDYMTSDSTIIENIFGMQIRRMLLLLMAVSILLIVTERNEVANRKVENHEILIEGRSSRLLAICVALFVFTLSGVFGWLVLNHWEGHTPSPLMRFGLNLPSTALFPAFTGLFGIATLMFSYRQTPQIMEQKSGHTMCKMSIVKIGDIREKLNIEKSYHNDNRTLIMGCGTWHEWKGKTCPACSHQEAKNSPDDSWQAVSVGSIAGSIAGLLPGVTPGIGTIFSMQLRNFITRLRDGIYDLITEILPKSWIPNFTEAVKMRMPTMYSKLAKERRLDTTEQVIITLGAVNTAAAMVIMAALFIVLKARNGTSIVINEMIVVEQWEGIMPFQMTYIFVGMMIASLLGYYMTRYVGDIFAKGFIDFIEKLGRHKKPEDRAKTGYRKLIIWMIVTLFLLVFIFTGLKGVLILITASAIGYLPPQLGIRRSHAMGVLLLPVMEFYGLSQLIAASVGL